MCEESADFGSPDLKLYASEFYSVNEQQGRPFEVRAIIMKFLRTWLHAAVMFYHIFPDLSTERSL